MAGDGDKADGLQHFEFSVEIGYYTLQFLEFNLYLKFDKNYAGVLYGKNSVRNYKLNLTIP